MDWNKTNTARNRQVVKVWSGSKTLSKADRGYMGTRESLPLPYDKWQLGTGHTKTIQAQQVNTVTCWSGKKRQYRNGIRPEIKSREGEGRRQS